MNYSESMAALTLCALVCGVGACAAFYLLTAAIWYVGMFCFCMEMCITDRKFRKEMGL